MSKNVILKLLGKRLLIPTLVSEYIKYLQEKTHYGIGSYVVEVNSQFIGKIIEIFKDFDSIPEDKIPKDRKNYLESFKLSKEFAIEYSMKNHEEDLWFGVLLFKDQKSDPIYLVVPAAFLTPISVNEKFEKFVKMEHNYSTDYEEENAVGFDVDGGGESDN